jgi:hypothetical protein
LALFNRSDAGERGGVNPSSGDIDNAPPGFFSL